MGKIKKLAGETVLYGLGTIIPRFINFLLVRLHTAEGVFVPEEYGVITKMFAYTAVINTILLFGMETAYFRFATRTGGDERRIFQLAQTVVVAISFFICTSLIIFRYQVADAVNVSGDSNYVIYLALIMFIDAVVAIPFARLRLQKKAMRFAVGKLINIGLLVTLNLYFLKINFNPAIGVGYVFIANLIANGFYLLFFLRILLEWRPRYDKEISGTMLSYGYPIMITGLAGITNEMFSRLALESWLPKDFYPGRSSEYALGIFGACYKLSVLMNLAVMAFRYAAEPFFFSNASDKQSPALFANVNHYFVIVCCFLLLVVGINLDVFKYFLGDSRYWEGLHIVPILLIAYLFLGVYFNFSVWFKLSDKTYWGTIITIAGVVVTVAANYILIPVYGYEGSSWAALICYFSMAMMCYFVGQRYLPIPYNLVRMFAYIAGTAILVYVVNKYTIPNTWLALSFHLLIMFGYLLTVFLLERKKFKQLSL